MDIAIIGTGYVGLVTGACLAEVGNNVICIDVDKDKIEKLQQGIIPIFEQGLEAIVKSNLNEGRLKFTCDLADAIPSAKLYFIAVGTPEGEDGSADLTYVLTVAKQIGDAMQADSLIVNKSTVPIGTAEKVRAVVSERLQQRNVTINFDVVSNPEFLKQGAAVADFMKPDRIVVGCNNERSRELMRRVYAPFTRNHDRMIFMDIQAAEMTKYAANAMLATKISFMNEIANICDRFGIDVEHIRKGIGSDSRIGYSFIYPGCGYGGSCFPKDVKALIRIADEKSFTPHLLHAVDCRNQQQKGLLYEKIIRRFGPDLTGLKFGLWGLAFKPSTDDMREAPSIVLLHKLINAGASVIAYDPVAMDMSSRILPQEWFEGGKLKLADHQYGALLDVDAMLLVTEWKSFRDPDFAFMKRVMKNAIIFDGRNQYALDIMAEYGFEYEGIGRKLHAQ